jgi:hypothetical protein
MAWERGGGERERDCSKLIVSVESQGNVYKPVSFRSETRMYLEKMRVISSPYPKTEMNA